MSITSIYTTTGSKSNYIASMQINNGILIAKYVDGTELELGKVQGKDGRDFNQLTQEEIDELITST